MMKHFAVFLLLWLILNETLSIGLILMGVGIAALGAAALRRLQTHPGAVRRPRVAIKLLAIVVTDVLRSNLAVARIVLGLAPSGRVSGFLPIPLSLRAPAGLAVLACIVTATPGTSWVRYQRDENLLTLHVLDLADPQALIGEIKSRYERPLMEIFE